MLKQRVRQKRTVWIENGKPRHGTIWASMIAVKKLYKRAITWSKLVYSNKRGQCIKNLLLHNDGKFWKKWRKLKSKRNMDRGLDQTQKLADEQ